MRHLQKAVLSFLRNEDGPTAVEYAVMLALIIVVCITAITALGSNANNTFSYVGSQVGKTGGSWSGAAWPRPGRPPESRRATTGFPPVEATTHPPPCPTRLAWFSPAPMTPRLGLPPVGRCRHLLFRIASCRTPPT